MAVGRLSLGREAPLNDWLSISLIGHLKPNPNYNERSKRTQCAQVISNKPGR
jgi:hypothetical protein